MANENPEYSGLPSIPGVRFGSYQSMQTLSCPFCSSPNSIHLIGKISFAATISGNDLFDGRTQPLAAFICPQSHVFFLREQDAVKEPWKASA